MSRGPRRARTGRGGTLPGQRFRAAATSWSTWRAPSRGRASTGCRPGRGSPTRSSAPGRPAAEGARSTRSTWPRGWPMGSRWCPGGGPGAASPLPPRRSGDGPISLGTATVEQLDTIEGIGPVTAQQIVEFRDRARRPFLRRSARPDQRHRPGHDGRPGGGASSPDRDATSGIRLAAARRAAQPASRFRGVAPLAAAVGPATAAAAWYAATALTSRLRRRTGLGPQRSGRARGEPGRAPGRGARLRAIDAGAFAGRPGRAGHRRRPGDRRSAALRRARCGLRSRPRRESSSRWRRSRSPTWRSAPTFGRAGSSPGRLPGGAQTLRRQGIGGDPADGRDRGHRRAPRRARGPARCGPQPRGSRARRRDRRTGGGACARFRPRPGRPGRRPSRSTTSVARASAICLRSRART